MCPDELSDRHFRLMAKHSQVSELAAALKNKDHLTVGDLMTKQVTVVDQKQSVERVRELMRIHRTRHLVVQDRNNLVTGVVSDRDVTHDQRGTVSEVMTADPTTISSNRPISEAVGAMLSKRVSCLPVVDDVRLRGILTTTDLLVVLECLLENYEEAVQQARRSRNTADREAAVVTTTA